jgi:hypothetical protein
MIERDPMDSAGKLIHVGDRVTWRGQIYTIKAFGDRVGHFHTRSITFEETLHVSNAVPDEIGVDLVEPTSSTKCRWCGEDCPRWGEDVCPLRPRQLPRLPRDIGFEAHVVTIQATHNPGCWAVQFRVTRAEHTRTFWRWYTKRCLNQSGAYVTPDNDPPTADEVLVSFWDDEFGDLHGFDFETTKEDP